jgi:hypothetical protein
MELSQMKNNGKNKIRSLSKLKIRMAQWLNLHLSEYDLKISEYIIIANRLIETRSEQFSRNFNWQIQELHDFEKDKAIRENS